MTATSTCVTSEVASTTDCSYGFQGSLSLDLSGLYFFFALVLSMASMFFIIWLFKS